MNAIGRRPVPIRSGIARSVFCCGCCTTSGGKSQLGMIIMSAVFMVICIAMYVNMGYFSRYNCESKIALAQQVCIIRIADRSSEMYRDTHIGALLLSNTV